MQYAVAPAIQGGWNLFSTLMGNRAQTRLTQQGLAQQLQQFREQQAFLERQALEDQRRYDQQQALEKTRWDAQQQLRAPYRQAGARLLEGAFGGPAIGRYPGGSTLGDLMARG